MDANNIRFVISDGEEGYPSGHWGGACLDVLFKYSSKMARLNSLAEIYNISDDQHSRELDHAFGPDVRETLVRYWGHKIDVDTAAARLEYHLAMLPYLIYAAFPQIREAVQEYADRDLELRREP